MKTTPKSSWQKLCAYASITLAFSAQANEQDLVPSALVQLEDSVVTANRVATPLQKITSSVTVITSEELQQRKPFSLHDALATTPGLIIRRNGPLGSTNSVSIRGSTDTQVLLLIDGVKISDPASSSSVNFDLIPTGNIERIEVLRGSHSVVYGADAVGGVINIITKKPNAADPLVTLDILGGSFETGRAQARIQGTEAGFFYSAFYSHLETEGFSSLSPDNAESEDFETTHFDGLLGYNFNDNISIKGVYKFTDSQNDYDGFGAPNDASRYNDNEQHYFLVEPRFELWEDRIISRPMLSYTKNNVDLPTDFFATTSDLLNFDWQNNVQATDYLHFVGGYEYEELNGESTGSFDNSNKTHSVYLLSTLNPIENLTIDLGIRLDDNNDFGSEETWRVAAAYFVEQTHTLIHANIGTSFKAPSISQLFNPNFGNPALQAELGEGFDIGIEQSFFENRLTTGVTYFQNDIEDQIIFDTALPGPFGGRFNNTAEVQTKGYEVFIKTSPVHNVDITLNYTWFDAEDQLSGLDLARQPHHAFSGAINWLTLDDRLNLNFIVTYRGERFNGANETGRLGGYIVCDAAATYQLNDSVELYGKVDNVLDRDYEDINGFATADLSGYLGIRYFFK